MTTPELAAPEETAEVADIEEPTVPDEGAEETDPEGAEQLGEPGKRALDAMKDKWKSEREKRRELEQKLSEQAAPTDGDQPDTEARVRKAEQDATAKANARIVRSEIRAAAAGKLADPKDALTFIDPSQFEVDDDGQVDETEVAEAIEDLLKNKPYLAAQGGKKQFQGTAESGARKGTGRPAQLTEDDLKRLSKEGKNAEIVKARDEGRLNDVLGLNR